MTLRYQLFWMMGIFVAVLGWTVYEAQQSNRWHKYYLLELDRSHLLEREIDVTFDKAQRKDILIRLTKWKENLSPQTRADAVGQMVDAIQKRKVDFFYDRIKAVRWVEKQYRQKAQQQVSYYEKRATYFAAVSVLIVAFGLIMVFMFVNLKVVRPVQHLAKRMLDFLNDRYTYQFSTPSFDEIGHLHATFNSLAQRVLHNMEELQRLDQAKSDFLSIASHELRTPLTSIKGSLSLLKSGVMGEMNSSSQDLLKIAEIETDRLIRLINDLLDLAKIEAKNLPLHKDWVHLQEIMKTTVDSLQGFAQQAQISLTMIEGPSLEIYADSDRVQQVLTNLLSNAIKFSPQQGQVYIQVQFNEAQDLVIAVKDQGQGIAPQDQEHIFQKFTQATSARNPLVKGTGLGLAIAKAIVEEHDGQIYVKSTLGHGSTFSFTIPQWRFLQAKENRQGESEGAAA